MASQVLGDDPSRYTCKVAPNGRKYYLKDGEPVLLKDIPKKILKQIPNPSLDPSFYNISNYSVSYVSEKLTYTFQGKKIAIKNIPKEIIEKLGRPLPPKQWPHGTPYPNYEGFSYLESFGRKYYYYYGQKVTKDCVPKEYLDKLPNMIPRRYSWSFPKDEENTEEEERKEEKTEEEERKEEVPAGIPKNYHTLSPFQLLKACGIYDRKGWHRWMRSNHPDKNPDIDPILVAMVNNAMDVMYPR